MARRIARAAREDPLFRGTVVFLTCLHELGHAFGLRHTDAFADIIRSFRYVGDFLTHFMRFREEPDRRSDSRSRIPPPPRSRNKLVVPLLAQRDVSGTARLGRSHIMDRPGDGVPGIPADSGSLSGRTPEFTMIDESELRLVNWGAS